MSEALPFNVLQAAAEWFALLSSGEATEAERTRWQAWLAQSNTHRAAWQRVESVSQNFTSFNVAQTQGPAMLALDAAGRMRRNRRQALKMLVLLCSVGTVAWGGLQAPPLRRALLAQFSDYSTGVGEQREIVLADGSQLWLNSATRLDADYGATLRRLHLHEGEVLIETAADAQTPARALVVDTEQGRLRALGTRFTVRQLDGATRLDVYAGAVEVTPHGAQAQVIAAGQQVRFSADAIASVQAAAMQNQAWSRGILFADNQPLGAFIEELSRHRHGHLACDPAIAQLKVAGAFPLADSERTLAMLEAVLPVRIERTLPWWVVVRSR